MKETRAFAFVDYCTMFADQIYVREQVNGKWDSYSLAELPGHLALAHVRRLLFEGRDPVLVTGNVAEGAMPELDQAVADAIRESGGSVPAGVCPECQQSPCIGHPRAGERPLLNKTGGSDVEGGDPDCVHDWRPYFAHLVCVKCGAAQRGAAAAP